MPANSLKMIVVAAIAILMATACFAVIDHTEESDAASYTLDAYDLYTASQTSYAYPSGTQIKVTDRMIGDLWYAADTNSYHTVPCSVTIDLFDGPEAIDDNLVGSKTISFTVESTPTTYTCYLYYNANGGSGAPTTQTYTGTSTSSHSFTVASGTPTRTGYTFLGWATTSSATSASYSAGDSISVAYNGSKTLYAVWQENAATSYTCYLKYNANGGSGAPSTQSYTGTSTSSHTFTVSSTEPTRSGYDFLGWNTYASATTALYSPGDSVSVGYKSTKTLYAIWQEEAVSYTVVIHKGNWGSFKMTGVDSDNVTADSKSYSIDEGQTISVTWYGQASVTGSGTGYTYVRTYTASENQISESLYGTALGSSVTVSGDADYYPASEMTFTTTYTYQFTVKYNANGGSGAPSTYSTTNSSSTKSITLSSTTPTRSGYTFLGWSKSSTATSATYTAGNTYTFFYGTTNLYAVWKQSYITVTGTPDSYGVVGTTWSYKPTVSVSGCSVSISGASWLSANGTNISGTPTSPGTYDVTLTFSKSGYTSVTKSFTITVLSTLSFESSPTGGAIIYAV